MRNLGDKLVVSDTSGQEINGSTRYNSDQNNGIWVRVA
jgi:hypothetical protein